VVVPSEDMPPDLLRAAQFHSVFGNSRREIFFRDGAADCGVGYVVSLVGTPPGVSYGVDSADTDILRDLFSLLFWAARRDLLARFAGQRSFMVLARVAGHVWKNFEEVCYSGNERTRAMPAIAVRDLFGPGRDGQMTPAEVALQLEAQGTLDVLTQRLDAQNEKFADIESGLAFVVERLELIFFPLELGNARGACMSRATRTITAGRLMIEAPASARGYCFYAVALPALGLTHSREAADAAALAVGLPQPRAGVTVDEAIQFARMRGIALTVVNADGTQLDSCEADDPARPRLHLCLHAGHWWRVLNADFVPQRCGRCYRVFKWKHQCNAARAAEINNFRNRVKFVRSQELRQAMPDLGRICFMDFETLVDQWEVDEWEWFSEALATSWDGGELIKLGTGRGEGPIARTPGGWELTEADGQWHRVTRGSGRLEVYAVGAMMGLDEEVTVFWGPNALEEFMDWLIEKRPTTVASFNGSKFDTPILLRGAARRRWRISDLLVHNGRILGGQCGPDLSRFKFWDLVLFLSCTLREATESFGVPTRKGLVPHRILSMGERYGQGRSPWEMLNYVGPWPGVDAFFDKERAEAHAYLADPARSEMLDVRREFTAYLQSDVRALKELFVVLQETIYTLFAAPREGEPDTRPPGARRYENVRVDLTQFCTTPQLAYAIWRSEAPPHTVEIPLDVERANACKDAYYGGLVRPLRLHFKSAQFAEATAAAQGAPPRSADEEATLKKLFESIRDYLSAMDMNSMYPNEMATNPYPSGLGRRMEPEELELVGRQQDAAGPGRLYVAHVRFVPRQNLFHPILPRREGGQLLWSLEPGEGWYSSVDLDMARAEGYELEADDGWAWDTTTNDLFKSLVETLMALKDRGKREQNMVLRNLAKLLANALYGKFGQRAKRESVVVCYTLDGVKLFLRDNSWTDIVPLDGNAVIMIGEKHDDGTSALTKPLPIALFVTAYSRRALYRVRKMLDPTLSRPKRSETYTDTDCLHLHARLARKMERRGLVGKLTGQFSEDLLKLAKGAIAAKIIAETCVRPKLYELVVLFLMEPTEEIPFVHLVLKSDFSSKGIPAYTWHRKELLADGKVRETAERDFFDQVVEAYSRAAADGLDPRAVRREVPYDSIRYTHLNAAAPFSHFHVKAKRSVTAGWKGRVYNPVDGYWYPRGWLGQPAPPLT